MHPLPWDTWGYVVVISFFSVTLSLPDDLLRNLDPLHAPKDNSTARAHILIEAK